MTDLATIASLLVLLSNEHQQLGQAYAALAQELESLRPVDIDTLTLARAIQGEEAGHFGSRREELGTWIAHTAVNRWNKPWWKQIDGVPCTFASRIEYDWHGTALVEQPEPWAVGIATRVLAERRSGGEDKARGALFAMSLEDLEYNRWTARAHQVKIHVIPAPTSRAQFWFMSNDPASKEVQREKE